MGNIKRGYISRILFDDIINELSFDWMQHILNIYFIFYSPTLRVDS